MRENHSVTGALDSIAGPDSSGGSIIFEGGGMSSAIGAVPWG